MNTPLTGRSDGATTEASSSLSPVLAGAAFLLFLVASPRAALPYENIRCSCWGDRANVEWDQRVIEFEENLSGCPNDYTDSVPGICMPHSMTGMTPQYQTAVSTLCTAESINEWFGGIREITFDCNPTSGTMYRRNEVNEIGFQSVTSDWLQSGDAGRAHYHFQCCRGSRFKEVDIALNRQTTWVYGWPGSPGGGTSFIAALQHELLHGMGLDHDTPISRMTQGQVQIAGWWYSSIGTSPQFDLGLILPFPDDLQGLDKLYERPEYVDVGVTPYSTWSPDFLRSTLERQPVVSGVRDWQGRRVPCIAPSQPIVVSYTVLNRSTEDAGVLTEIRLSTDRRILDADPLLESDVVNLPRHSEFETQEYPVVPAGTPPGTYFVGVRARLTPGSPLEAWQGWANVAILGAGPGTQTITVEPSCP